MIEQTPAPKWRKSSHSDSSGNDCVEVAGIGDVIGVRDSKNPDAGHFSLTPDRFAALLSGIKNG